MNCNKQLTMSCLTEHTEGGSYLMRSNRIKKTKGYALLVVILAVFLVMTFGAVIFTRVNNETLIRASQERRINLSYAAQAGAEESFYVLHKAIIEKTPIPVTVDVLEEPGSKVLVDVTIADQTLTNTMLRSFEIKSRAKEDGKWFQVLVNVQYTVKAGSNQVGEFKILSYERSFDD